jgi:hypothetical protein
MIQLTEQQYKTWRIACVRVISAKLDGVPFGSEAARAIFGLVEAMRQAGVITPAELQKCAARSYMKLAGDNQPCSDTAGEIHTPKPE